MGVFMLTSRMMLGLAVCLGLAIVYDSTLYAHESIFYEAVERSQKRIWLAKKHVSPKELQALTRKEKLDIRIASEDTILAKNMSTHQQHVAKEGMLVDSAYYSYNAKLNTWNRMLSADPAVMRYFSVPIKEMQRVAQNFSSPSRNDVAPGVVNDTPKAAMPTKLPRMPLYMQRGNPDQDSQNHFPSSSKVWKNFHSFNPHQKDSL
jgi:hypothetical protein